MGAFWAQVIGLEVVTSPGKVSLDGARPSQRVWINAVDRPKRVKNRLHLDVYAASVDELVDLGATVLPVILKSYAPQFATAAVALVVGILIGRRSRRR